MARRYGDGQGHGGTDSYMRQQAALSRSRGRVVGPLTERMAQAQANRGFAAEIAKARRSGGTAAVEAAIRAGTIGE